MAVYNKFNTNTFNPLATNDDFNIKMDEQLSKENQKPNQPEEFKFESRRKNIQHNNFGSNNTNNNKLKQEHINNNVNDFNIIGSRRKKLVI
jgi:hypothetical protein